MLTGFHWFLRGEEESLKTVFLTEAEAFGLSKPCRTLSWKTKAVLKGSPYGSVEAAVETTALSPAVVGGAQCPPLPPRGPQLGPWHLLSLDPATSTRRLCPRSCLSLVWQHVPPGDNEWLENK